MSKYTKPTRRILIKQLIYLHYDKGYNHSHDEWEAYHKEVNSELLEALTIAKEWLEKDVIERGFKKLILAKSPVVEALSILEQAIRKAEGKNE